MNDKFCMKLVVLVFVLLLSSQSQSSEVVTDGSVQANEHDIELDIKSCTANQISQNLKIRKDCKSNWKQLGLEEPPAEGELRSLKECSGSLIKSESIEGCTDALLALPILISETAALGVVAMALEPAKDSFIYVYQNGTLNEIKAYLSNEFFREMCELAPSDINAFPSTECPDAESHINLNAHQQCRAQALKTIDQAKKCHRAQRTAYKAKVTEINKTAMEIFNAREKSRRIEIQSAEKLKSIRESCGPSLNPFGSVSGPYITPSHAIARGAKALQNLVYPNDQEVESFNKCVNKNTMDDPELRAELIESSNGLIEQIIGYANSMHCFNLRERSAMKCHVAKVVYTGGGAVLAKSAIKKVGRVTVKRIGKRIEVRKARTLKQKKI